MYDHHDLTKTLKTCTGSQTGAAYRTVAKSGTICRCICVTVSGRPISIRHRTAAICHLCAGRGGKRAGRSDPASVYPAVENFLAGKNPQYGQCADPRYSIACPYGGSPPASLPFRVQLFRTQQEWPGLDRNGCRRGRCTACFRQVPDLNMQLWAIRG